MAQCKSCDRSGIFFSVNSDGLCSSCASIVVMDVSQKVRLVNDCAKLVEESSNLDVQLSRYDFLMENLYGLLKYERKGIATCSPAPSVFINTYRGRKDEIIVKYLKSALETAKEKMPLASSVKTKINQLTKILLKVRDYKSKVTDAALLKPTEQEIVDLIHRIQLDGYLDAAKKAEFKGQRKKALDQYYEALYFLKHDEIDDALQAEHISQIEKKIVDLGAATTKA